MGGILVHYTLSAMCSLAHRSLEISYWHLRQGYPTRWVSNIVRPHRARVQWSTMMEILVQQPLEEHICYPDLRIWNIYSVLSVLGRCLTDQCCHLMLTTRTNSVWKKVWDSHARTSASRSLSNPKLYSLSSSSGKSNSLPHRVSEMKHATKAAKHFVT